MHLDWKLRHNHFHLVVGEVAMETHLKLLIYLYFCVVFLWRYLHFYRNNKLGTGMSPLGHTASTPVVELWSSVFSKLSVTCAALVNSQRDSMPVAFSFCLSPVLHAGPKLPQQPFLLSTCFQRYFRWVQDLYSVFIRNHLVGWVGRERACPAVNVLSLSQVKHWQMFFKCLLPKYISEHLTPTTIGQTWNYFIWICVSENIEWWSCETKKHVIVRTKFSRKTMFIWKQIFWHSSIR